MKEDDAISRQAVHETIERWAGSMNVLVALPNREIRPLLDSIHDLSPVTPAEKMAHWEWEPYYHYPGLGNWHCSECECVVVECVHKNEKGGIPLYKYCPQCGAKMEDSNGRK